jgi:hypothetical protein
MRKVVIGAVVISVGLLCTLLLTETVLRVRQRPQAPVIGWTGGRPAEKNQFGLRGHRFDPSADVRLLLLGDSQVAGETEYGDMAEVYLRRAVAEATGASVSVASIGDSGWGQDQELLALKAHLGEIRPSTVVLWFTEGNDLWNNTFPTHFPKDGNPKPTFWLEGDELKGPNVAWLETYRPRGLYLLQALSRVRGIPLYPIDSDWEAHLPPPYRAAVPPAGTRSLVQVLADQHGIRPDQVPYFRDENFDTEKTHYSLYLVPESPRLKYAAALTRALLLRIRTLSEASGAKFYILTTERWDTATIPDAPTMFEVNGKGYTLSSASALRVVDGILEGLPAVRVTGIPPDDVISKTDSHWNGAGNKYVMDRVAREVTKDLPHP